MTPTRNTPDQPRTSPALPAHVTPVITLSEPPLSADFLLRGRTIKLANSPPCACRGSTGQKPYYGLMTLTYQRYTAVLLSIYGSRFLSGIY